MAIYTVYVGSDLKVILFSAKISATYRISGVSLIEKVEISLEI